MPAASRDPYEVLGLSASASDAELRAAYRRLVQHHHPDHNNGSLESARRFEEVQEAYARIVKQRAQAGPDGSSRHTGGPEVEARLADLERQVREARAARERAERAAAQARREAARVASADLREQAGRPSDEELGYVTTDDTFSKLIDDAWKGLRGWLDEHRSDGRP